MTPHQQPSSENVEPNTQPGDETGKWQALLTTARRQGGVPSEGEKDRDEDASAPAPEPAPGWLLSKLPTLREAAAVMARTFLWQRWSWLAALAAALLFLVVWLLLRGDRPEPQPAPLIAPPVEITAPIEP
jgi:hypothetical protein